MFYHVLQGRESTKASITFPVGTQAEETHLEKEVPVSLSQREIAQAVIPPPPPPPPPPSSSVNDDEDGVEFVQEKTREQRDEEGRENAILLD